MQLTLPQHYIVKTQENISYYFFLNNDREICYQVFNENNFLAKNEILVKEITVDFSVTINSSNEIHLICITKVGNLLYYIGSDNGWHHKLLFKLDVRSNIYRYLLLFIENNYVHIFCVKTNLLNPIVSSIEHMYWNEKNFHRSTVASYLPGKYPSSYQVQIDQLNNIHIIYKVLYKNNHQLYYSKFNFLNKKWTPGEIITNIKEDHSHPYALIDKKEQLHLVWCTIEENNFTLKYRKKINILSQKSKWSNTQTISNKNANHLSPIIVQQGSLLKVLSRQNHHISEIVSQDYGNSWVLLNMNKLYKPKEPLLIRYSSNFPEEKAVYSLQHVYGEISDHISLFGIKLYKSREKNTSDFKQIISETIDVEQLSLPTSMDTKKEDGDLPTSKESNGDTKLKNVNNLSDPNRDINFHKLLQNIENHIVLLMMEFDKLREIKNSLQKKISTEDNVNIPIEYNEFKILLDSFNLMVKNFTSIERAQSTFKKESEAFREELDSLDKKVAMQREELQYLHEEIQKISYDTGFLNKIKNLFS